jgi:ubiquinone/menaquinone biosynthesis C-methylase UbiE/uncharacterized protein YbaR (Trm112 family)
LWAALRCPVCRATLSHSSPAELMCSDERRHRFDIIEGIPVLLDRSLLETSAQYEGQRAYFDAEFAGYSSYELDNWRLSFLQRMRQARTLGGPDAPVIDVGVGGSGYTVIEAARSGYLAAGCDLSMTGLITAKRLAEREGVADRTIFVCASAEELPFADETFGCGLSIAVFEHVPDDRAAIAELARVLRPSGRVFVTVPHRMRHFSPIWWLPNWLHDRRIGHLRRYDAATMGEALTANGFFVEHVQHTGRFVKVVQVLLQRLVPRIGSGRVWWMLERRDLARVARARGAMQLSVVARRSS